MAETPKKPKSSPSNSKCHSPSRAVSYPLTPAPTAPRRSLRRTSFTADSETAAKHDTNTPEKFRTPKTPKLSTNLKRLRRESKKLLSEPPFCPASPDPAEPKRRKRSDENDALKAVSQASRRVCFELEKKKKEAKRRIYYKKVVYDGGEFSIGDDVYVKRREDVSSDDEDPEVEDCRICFKSGKAVMIECDGCLGGFHLKCLRPPLKEVPEEDWLCEFCEGRRMGKKVDPPSPPKGKKRSRTAREKLLSSDLWAARIKR